MVCDLALHHYYQVLKIQVHSSFSPLSLKLGFHFSMLGYTHAVLKGVIEAYLSVKHRFESQTKPTNFHRIFNFNAVTDQTDAFPVLFGKKCVIVGIKCWSLMRVIKIFSSKRYVTEH